MDGLESVEKQSLGGMDWTTRECSVLRSMTCDNGCLDEDEESKRGFRLCVLLSVKTGSRCCLFSSGSEQSEVVQFRGRGNLDFVEVDSKKFRSEATILRDSQPVNSHPFICLRIETRTTKIQQHKSSSLQLVITGAIGHPKYFVVRSEEWGNIEEWIEVRRGGLSYQNDNHLFAVKFQREKKC
ncbi:hypothetical protein AVEN_189852-1 [Araneus ventricosus]|uniref:Uncharacterized protein n=1 Tax=Araneus ventricosus TaxID=182803 RepID=A0A4Y2ED54_ARAVE|nr:hypothetical protein AVEN_189852-1 [Araneus ventricosus]